MKSKTQPITAFYRQSFTERIVFQTKPDRATRLALRSTGWHWNPAGHWWRNTNSLTPLKPADLAAILTPANDNAEQPEAATA